MMRQEEASNFEREFFDFSGDFRCRLFTISQEQKQLHCHNCLELNLVERGSGTYIIGGKVYPVRKGDIFVINNSELHLALHGREELRLTVLLFESSPLWQERHGNDYLKPFFHRNEQFSNRIAEDAADYASMYEAFSCMKREERNGRGSSMVMESALHLLLALLYRHYQESQAIGENTENGAGFERLERVIAYIDSHLTEEITLDALAEQAAVSRNYLCKCFREATGRTIFSYIEQMRIEYAAYLLRATRKPIAQVAVEAGFESVSYFNRLFRRQYQMTPSELRRGKKNGTEERMAQEPQTG